LIDTIIVKSDGAARGNPGPAGLGAVVCDASGQVLAEAAEYIGEATNNVAEYSALILGLKVASRFPAAALKVYLDSELLVNQLNGVYKVKNATLRELYVQAQSLIGQYKQAYVGHVPRAKNSEADRLANEAIDNYMAGEIEIKRPANAPGQGSLF
jgi:ribonuclease HI